MNRGDRREPIFKDDDRQRFVETLGEACEERLAGACVLPDAEGEDCARLGKETLVAVRWISWRLEMGSIANVNTLLYLWRKGRLKVSDHKN